MLKLPKKASCAEILGNSNITINLGEGIWNYVYFQTLIGLARLALSYLILKTNSTDRFEYVATYHWRSRNGRFSGLTSPVHWKFVSVSSWPGVARNHSIKISNSYQEMLVTVPELNQPINSDS